MWDSLTCHRLLLHLRQRIPKFTQNYMSCFEEIANCQTDSIQSPSIDIFSVTDTLHYRFPIESRSDSNGLWHTYWWGFVIRVMDFQFDKRMDVSDYRCNSNFRESLSPIQNSYTVIPRSTKIICFRNHIRKPKSALAETWFPIGFYRKSFNSFWMLPTI